MANEKKGAAAPQPDAAEVPETVIETVTTVEDFTSIAVADVYAKPITVTRTELENGTVAETFV